jgi:hypothetical protein
MIPGRSQPAASTAISSDLGCNGMECPSERALRYGENMGLNRHYEEETLLAHIHGELSAADENELIEHLARCWLCRSRADELRREFQALADSVQRDLLMPRKRVWKAKAKLTEQIAQREADLQQPDQHKSMLNGLSWRWLGAAASVLICIGAALFWFLEENNTPGPAEVLARVELAEASYESGPIVFQRLHIEISQVEPQGESTASELETWSDPETARFTSRWVGLDGTLEYARWKGQGHDGTASYDWTRTGGTSARTRGGSEFLSLLNLGEFGLATEELSRGFVSWLGSRPWRPVRLSENFRLLVDEQGTDLRLERVFVDGREFFRVEARKNLKGRVAVVILDINSSTYEPQMLRVRYEVDGRISELRIRQSAIQVISTAALDASVFDPRLPTEVGAARVPGRLQLEALPRDLSAIRSSTAKPSRSEMVAAEIRIHYAVHEAEACLRESVQVVEAETGGLIVNGIVANEMVKARVMSRLTGADLPEWVAIEVRTIVDAEASVLSQGDAPVVGSDEGMAKPGPAVSPRAEGPLVLDPRLPVQSELERYFGTHDLPGGAGVSSDDRVSGNTGDKITVFTDRAVALADEALAEAWALRRLAQRFGDEKELDVPSSATIRRMLTDHLASLDRIRVERRNWLMPVVEAVASQRELTVRDYEAEMQDADQLSVDWADGCLELFAAVEQTHKSVMALFAVNIGKLSTEVRANLALGALLESLQRADVVMEVARRGALEVQTDERALRGEGSP